MGKKSIMDEIIQHQIDLARNGKAKLNESVSLILSSVPQDKQERLKELLDHLNISLYMIVENRSLRDLYVNLPRLLGDINRLSNNSVPLPSEIQELVDSRQID